MKASPDFLQWDRHGISPADITRMVFGCDPDCIHPDVILMPWWQADVFSLWVGPIETIAKGTVYQTEYHGKPVSILRSGIGAPQTGDAVLALGCTPCERVLFAGSVGALRPEIRIGDLLIPTLSLAGDGFCRYLEAGFPKRDCFLERVTPDEPMTTVLLQTTTRAAQDAGVALHTGPVFAVDSILAQFGFLRQLAEEYGCIGIEMETAAAFKAARAVGLRAAALLSVSDVPVLKKSLYAGRSPEEREHRRETRRKVLAKAALDCLDTISTCS